MISNREKAHHILQAYGARFCPFNQREDSESLPPALDESCHEGQRHGYTFYEVDGKLCVLYNTRCFCSLNIGMLYTRDSHKALTDWLPLLRKEFHEAHLDYTEESRPYINLEVRDVEGKGSKFDYPLYSPHVQYTFEPLPNKEREK